ncbi:MAG TPA: VWA domain-containing protein [Bryobacteraceae bacterium]|nr:VWA domain-containing protein [Bryobacteraceae bacterium]
MRRWIAFFVVAGLAFPQQEQDFTFKAAANLVVVNVVVRDRDGKVVEGLKPEQFTVVENGKAQTVSVFEFQRLSGTRLSAERPASVTAPAAVASPGPGPLRYRDRRLLVLFFDFAGMPIPDQIRAQEAAVKFLNEQMTESDSVAIMSFGAVVKLEQEFTDDRQALLEAIKMFRIGEGLTPSITGDLPEGEDTTGIDEAELDLFNTDRRLAGLENAARMLAPFPEKKALIYFSSGSTGSGTENAAQLQATINAAVRSNVSYYPIDVRGLQAMPPGGSASQASSGGTGVFTGQAQRGQRDRQNTEQDTLYALASDTGGKASFDSNDLTMGMQQAQDDLQSYYTLGYYSTNESRDGRFRKVEVKLAGVPNAKLDYRTGYYGEKEWNALNKTDRERQLQEALMLGDPKTEIALALEVDWFRMNPTKFFLPVAVRIPGSAVTLSKKNSADFDFIGVVRDAKGKAVANVRDQITIKLPEESAAQLPKRSVLYDTGFTLTPGVYSIRFLVRENETGKMGTFETKFTIPEKPVLSTVVWGSQLQPVKSAVGAAEKPKKWMENHPLVHAGQKLMPSVTRVFRTHQRLLAYLEMYDGATAAATVSFFKDGRKVFESSPVRATASERNATPLQIEVPLKGIPPGRYQCQVNVVDAAGQRFAWNRTPLTIVR